MPADKGRRKALLSPMVSYAENGEDVILRRVFSGPKGFYLDVGAAFPTVASITKHFYDQGWHGINIEPHKGMCAMLKKARSRDINLDCAIGSRPGRAVMSHFSDSFGLSTLDAQVTKQHVAAGRTVSTTSVTVRTLDDMLQHYAKRKHIDFMKIDVEGGEEDVLRSCNLAQWDPTVLVVESTVPTSQKPSYRDWEGIVLRAGYRCALFDGLNRYYAKKNDKRMLQLLSLPPNPFDEYVPFKWWAMVAPELREQYLQRNLARGRDMRAFSLFEKQWPSIRKEFHVAWGYDV